MKILNNYIQIQPITSDSFVMSQKDTYEEVGTVLALDDQIKDIPIGSKVYFDSWLVKKYPVANGYYWFISRENVVAYE